MSSKIYEANDYWHDLDSLIPFSQYIAYFISYEKWVQRERCPDYTCHVYLSLKSLHQAALYEGEDFDIFQMIVS